MVGVNSIASLVDPHEQFEEFDWDDNQYRVYRYLRNGFRDVQSQVSIGDAIVEIIMIALLALFGVPVGFLIVWLTSFLLIPVAWMIGDSAYYLLLFYPLFITPFASLIRDMLNETWTTFHDDGRFRLGGLHCVVESSQRSTILFFLTFFLGFQIGTIYSVPGHLGLDIGGSLWECTVLSLDNMMFGIFFDTFEIYSLSFGKRLEHTTWSASLFFYCRIGYQAALVTWFFYVIQAIRVYRQLNSELWSVEPQEFMKAIRRFISQRKSMPWHLFEDIVFVMICEKYLQSNYLAVEELSRRFETMHVENETRELFVDAEENQVFLSTDKNSFDSSKTHK